MTDLFDIRAFPVIIPTRPEQESQLLDWAQRATRALIELRDAKVLYRVITKAYAATISIDPAEGNVFKISLTGDATINLESSNAPGEIRFIFVNDGTVRTVTFGTGFTDSGNLVGTANKTAVVSFVSDGTTYYEVSRTTGL